MPVGFIWHRALLHFHRQTMILTDFLIGYGAPLPVAVIDSSEGRKNGLTKIEKANDDTRRTGPCTAEPCL